MIADGEYKPIWMSICHRQIDEGRNPAMATSPDFHGGWRTHTGPNRSEGLQQDEIASLSLSFPMKPAGGSSGGDLIAWRPQKHCNDCQAPCESIVPHQKPPISFSKLPVNPAQGWVGHRGMARTAPMRQTFSMVGCGERCHRFSLHWIPVWMDARLGELVGVLSDVCVCVFPS